MGLETASFIQGLTATWPLAGDLKSQGDDHIRLIKAVLQATFPNATRAFAIPSMSAVAATASIPAAGGNNLNHLVNTAGGAVTLTLPTLTAADNGWSCRVTKVTTDGNIVQVAPPTGTILSRVGGTATVAVAAYYEPVTFEWTGTAWFAYKPGPAIGSTMNFYGGTIPLGYIDCNGAAYSNTVYPELFAILASSVAPDVRGRVESGLDAGTGRMTTSSINTPNAVGGVGGADFVGLAAGNIPTITSSVSVSVSGGISGTTATVYTLGGSPASAGAGFGIVAAAVGVSGSFSGSGSGSATSNNTGGAAHINVQPTIMCRKLIRAA